MLKKLIEKIRFQQLIKNHVASILFSLFFIIYNLNMRTLPQSDSAPTSLVPFSLLEYHNLSLDQFSNYLIMNNPWTVVQVGGHCYSYYPVVLPILLTPLYILPYMFLRMIHCPIDMFNPGFQLIVLIMEKFCSASIAAGAGAFLYLALKEIVTKRIAVITSAIFAVATSTWATSSQNLWQHGLIELFLAILIFMVFRSKGHISIRNAIIMGIISGLFVFNRPSDSLLLLPIIFYIIWSKDNIIYYCVSGILAALPFLAYNLYHFGKFFGPYSYLAEDISLNNMSNILGLLVSPSRGILIYSPIVILAIFGFLVAIKSKDKSLRFFFITAGIAVVLELLVYGSFECWYSGGSYGPRFLTGLLPILGLFIGIYLNGLGRKNDSIIFIISILVIWSIFTQVVGAFYAPNGWWCCVPSGLETNSSRLWNWSDMEIFRTFNAGPYPLNPMTTPEHVLELLSNKTLSGG